MYSVIGGNGETSGGSLWLSCMGTFDFCTLFGMGEKWVRACGAVLWPFWVVACGVVVVVFLYFGVWSFRFCCVCWVVFVVVVYFCDFFVFVCGVVGQRVVVMIVFSAVVFLLRLLWPFMSLWLLSSKLVSVVSACWKAFGLRCSTLVTSLDVCCGLICSVFFIWDCD